MQATIIFGFIKGNYKYIENINIFFDQKIWMKLKVINALHSVN